MKRFDKRYIYYGLLSDFFTSLVLAFAFYSGFLPEEDVQSEEMIFALPLFLVAFAVLYLCFVAYRILYYRTSGYELTETEIKCNRGVFFRKRSVLEYKKVHAINKKQNIFHRIFGIAILTVDSGSTNTAHQAEITIIERGKNVDSLLDKLNLLKETGAQSIENNVSLEERVLLSDDDSLYRFTSGKKMLYTLINIVTTAFFTAVFAVLAILVIGVCKLVLRFDFLGTWGEYFVVAVLLTVGAMLLVSAISFVGCMINSFVKYHSFTITKCANNIQISFGLLEKHTNTFGYDKIKAVKISQDIIQRILGFASIKLEVIGYTNEEGSNTAVLGVLVPFCKYAEVGDILERVLPDYVPEQKQTKSVSLFPFVSWFLLIFGILSAVTLSLAVVIMSVCGVSATVIYAVVLFVLMSVAVVIISKLISAILAYRNNGIAVRDGKMTAYSGGFTKTVTVFMTKNLIAAENVTTPLREKHGILSLVMHLRTNAFSNEVKVHIQEDTLAAELEKLLLL